MTSKPRISSVQRRQQRPDMAGLALKALPLAVALCFCPLLQADVINPNITGLPMSGTVAPGGTVSVQQLTADKLTLNQSTQRAVIDWQSFNIAGGKTVEFIQPDASAAVLNRVSASANMSDIAGTMTANGMVLLMNPNGVMFHQGANINVGSLIVTTGTINQASFEAGGTFGITGVTTGSITNQGSITATNAGLVALVAPSVTNAGAIVATGGRIALSGADRATVSLNNGLFEFAVDSGALGTNASISNSIGARLEGKNILLSTGDAAHLVSGVINLQGVQQASSAIVVDGNTVVLKSDLDATSISGSSNTVQVYDTASIQDAVKIAKTGTPGAGATVELQAGTFSEVVTLNKANLTLSGQTGAKLQVADNTDGITIAANNVAVQGLELAGPVTSSYLAYAWGSNVSRGLVVGDGITGFAIRNNNIHDVRNGILIHGRNSTGTVSNNRIENTKSGISVQYTDASGITISNNTEGTTGNEWGLNLHLNGHLDGSGNILGNAPPIAAAPTLTWQQSLLNLSTTNNGWAVQDQGYTSSNRTVVNVATSGSASNQGSRLTPLNTIPGGIDAVVTGGTVKVGAGTYAGFSVDKAGVTVLGDRGALDKAGAGANAPLINSCYAWGGSICSSVLIAAENVTVSGFDISNNSGPYGVQIGVVSGARANGATLSYNRIRDVHGVDSGDGIRAVAVEPADNVTVKYNLIEDISPTNSAANSWGQSVAGIFARVRGGATSNLAIEDNVIRNISISGATSSIYNGETVYNGAKGIWIGSSGGSPTASNVTIARNQISGVHSNLIAEGILVNHGKMYGQAAIGMTTGLTISGNTISDVTGDVSSHGIELSGPTPDAQVTQNKVDLATSTVANTAGVYIDSNANANNAGGSVTVSGNSLTGSGNGVAVLGNATVNASGNWWGTTSESAVLAKTSGSVDFSPFLMSGTDTNLVTAGFQGDTSNVAVTTLGAQTGSAGRIQEGLSLAGVGGTLNVAGGTYAENLQLSNRYNLRFSGATLQGLTLNAGAANSGIGGQVTTSGADGIAFNGAVNLLADTTLTANGGNIGLNGLVQNSGGAVRALTLTATSGGSSTAGNVTLSSDNDVSATVTADRGATLTGRSLSGSARAATLTANATNTINMSLDVDTADMVAGVRMDLSGRASSIGVNTKLGYLAGSFPSVKNKGTGVIFVNGVPLSGESTPYIPPVLPPVIVLPTPLPAFLTQPSPPAPVTLHASVDLNAQPATAASTGGNGTSSSSSAGGNGTTATGSATGSGAAGSTVVAAVTSPPQVTVTRSSPRKAGSALDQGQGAEIDLTPGN